MKILRHRFIDFSATVEPYCRVTFPLNLCIELESKQRETQFRAFIHGVEFTLEIRNFSIIYGVRSPDAHCDRSWSHVPRCLIWDHSKSVSNFSFPSSINNTWLLIASIQKFNSFIYLLMISGISVYCRRARSVQSIQRVKSDKQKQKMKHPRTDQPGLS